MAAKTLATNLARLATRREQLLKTLHHLAGERQQVERNTEWFDSAAYHSRVALLDGLRHEYRLEITQVERALRRIDKKEYGTCAVCHAPIDPRRLELIPHTEHCAACENFSEGQKQHASQSTAQRRSTRNTVR